MHQIIYYGSYLIIPFLCFVIYIFLCARQQQYKKLLVLSLILAFLSVLFMYARFVEPKLMVTRRSDQTDIGVHKKVALIADMHLGVYNGPAILEKIVQKINSEQVDAVLIAGDFTYHPSNIRRDYAPLNEIKVPIYAVLGNHDVQHPGPDIRNELELVLKGHGVNIIDNQMVNFGDGILVGLGDEYAGEDDVAYLDTVAKETDKPIVVLAHNPDTILKYSSDFILNEQWVTLTGHTHCGQLRLPLLYKLAIDNVVEGQWYDGGYYDLGGNSSGAVNKLYITCGTGEVGLPMRMFNPPAIDILQL